jgi:hypothetical protein
MDRSLLATEHSAYHTGSRLHLREGIKLFRHKQTFQFEEAPNPAQSFQLRRTTNSFRYKRITLVANRIKKEKEVQSDSETRKRTFLALPANLPWTG